MLYDIEFNKEKPIYLQIKEYIKDCIVKGMLQKEEKLPATRELAKLLKVSRNSVIMAYEYLEEEELVYTIKGKGVFVSDAQITIEEAWKIDWISKMNKKAKLAEALDTMKQGKNSAKIEISFRSIAPDPTLFNIEEVKRAFVNGISLEGDNVLNYGYAKGYKPLIQELLQYMESKGVYTEGKDILITNGFTEGLDILFSSLMEKGDIVLCENPTHNTAIKIMKLHELMIEGIEMEETGIHLEKLEHSLREKKVKLAYLVPSYHNPMAVVTTPQKRLELLRIFQQYNVPIIEDGFNEELRYSGAHIAPLVGLAAKGNSVIYIGSFSKVLFPGIRVGWILADKNLVSCLESVKRSRNIHTSVLDQSMLYEYLKGGDFEKYIKKVRRVYKEKYEFAIQCAQKYIPYYKLFGEGGLHIFLELNNIEARDLLNNCESKGISFMPGDIFYTNGQGKKTLRLGISRVTKEQIQLGFQIIGETIYEMEGKA